MSVESSKKTRARMQALVELHRNAAAKVPAACKELHLQASQHDSMATTPFGDYIRGGGELTPVEAAAHQHLGDLIPGNNGKMRPGPITILERVNHLITVSATVAHELLAIADAAIPPEGLDTRSICVAGESHDWWTPPRASPFKVKCDNVQEEGRNTGLCVRCRNLKSRSEQSETVSQSS